MEAANSSEPSVNFYKSTRCYIPEDGFPYQIHRRHFPITNQKCYHLKYHILYWHILDFRILRFFSWTLFSPQHYCNLFPRITKVSGVVDTYLVVVMNVPRLAQAACGKMNNEEALSKAFRTGTSRNYTTMVIRALPGLCRNCSKTPGQWNMAIYISTCWNRGKYNVTLNENGLPSVRITAQSSRHISLCWVLCWDSAAYTSEQQCSHLSFLYMLLPKEAVNYLGPM
jgi:hypothetical protein